MFYGLYSNAGCIGGEQRQNLYRGFTRMSADKNNPHHTHNVAQAFQRLRGPPSAAGADSSPSARGWGPRAERSEWQSVWWRWVAIPL